MAAEQEFVVSLGCGLWFREYGSQHNSSEPLLEKVPL